jgi:glycosyltransferase involved in cell wall biosynthesis
LNNELNKYPVVSIITVVFNNRDNFTKTCECIKELVYPNLEFVVVDGGSTDGTVNTIALNSDIVSKWISEPDKGIYDAMNKGLKMATGDYVWFLNAGDQPASGDILNKVFASVKNADVYYGDTEMIDEEGMSFGIRTLKTPPEVLTWKKMIDGMLVSHQSMIVRKSVAADYNPDYKYVADIDWTIRVLKNSSNIVNTHLTISRFLIGGFSRKNTIKSITERYKMLCKYFNPFYVLINHFKITFNFIVYIIKRRKLL